MWYGTKGTHADLFFHYLAQFHGTIILLLGSLGTDTPAMPGKRLGISGRVNLKPKKKKHLNALIAAQATAKKDAKDTQTHCT